MTTGFTAVPLPEKTVLEFLGRNADYLIKGTAHEVFNARIPEEFLRSNKRYVVAIIPIL